MFYKVYIPRQQLIPQSIMLTFYWSDLALSLTLYVQLLRSDKYVGRLVPSPLDVHEACGVLDLGLLASRVTYTPFTVFTFQEKRTKKMQMMLET